MKPVLGRCTRGRHFVLPHLDPKWLDQSSILHAGRTSRFAATAIKTQIEVSFDGIGQFKPPISDSSHQINPPSWTVILVSRLQIRRTGGCAQTAMNAIQKPLVVNPASHACDRNGRLATGDSRL